MMNEQIEEMQNNLHQGLKPLKETYGTEELCSILYDAGYRRQDEVAREIFADIEKCFCGGLVWCSEAKILDEGMFTELKEKYGV